MHIGGEKTTVKGYAKRMQYYAKITILGKEMLWFKKNFPILI